MKIIYLFIDGIGLGEENPETNPFTRFAKSWLSPLGGVARNLPAGLEFKSTDAHMGISGLPQSATGQTSLWTGLNGSEAMGFHMTGFPGPTLIRIIKEHSIIKRVVESGGRSTLVNAFSEKYLERIKKKPRLISASTHTQMASSQPLKMIQDLRDNKAIFMDITHEMMHRYFPDFKSEFPILDARERGRDLVHMSRDYDLTLYEYFLTDKAGHNQSFDEAEYTIKTLEHFLDGILDELDPQNDLLLIISDHGNMEDLSTKSHTHNKVPTLALGKDAGLIHEEIEALTDLPAFIYKRLGMEVDLKAAREELTQRVAEKAKAEKDAS